MLSDTNWFNKKLFLENKIRQRLAKNPSGELNCHEILPGSGILAGKEDPKSGLIPYCPIRKYPGIITCSHDATWILWLFCTIMLKPKRCFTNQWIWKELCTEYKEKNGNNLQRNYVFTEDNSEVTKSHPKGDDDIKFPIYWFHKWIEGIKMKLLSSMPTQVSKGTAEGARHWSDHLSKTSTRQLLVLPRSWKYKTLTWNGKIFGPTKVGVVGPLPPALLNLELNRLYNLKLRVFELLGERTNHSENE